MVPYACALLQEAEKTKKNLHDSYSAAKEKNLATVQYRREQFQRPGTTFSNFSDNVAVLRGHENCCHFATMAVAG